MSGSSGGTTTTKTAPWSGQQAYLSNVFQQAANQYNNQQMPGISLLYNDYINTADRPSAVTSIANNAYQAQLSNLSNGLNQPLANAMLQMGIQQSPYIASLQGLNDQLSSGTGVAQNVSNAVSALPQVGTEAMNNPAVQALFQQAGASNPYISAVANSAAGQTQNPYNSGLAAATWQQNGYINPLAQAGQSAMDNPSLAYLQQSASGAYLDPSTNPYLQRAVDSAMGQAQASIASQFNQGGRYGSGQMQDVQSRALGDIAAQAYTNQYQQERQNQLAAQQALGSQYATGVGQNIGALGQAGGLQQGQQGLNIQGSADLANQYQQALANQMAGYGQAASAQQGQQGLTNEALNAAGNQYTTGTGQNLQAWTNTGQLGNAQVQNALSGQQLGANNYQDFLNNWLESQQAAGNLITTTEGLQNQALGLSPYIQSLSTQDLQNLQNAAATQQWEFGYSNNYQTQQLQNYANLVAGNSWGQQTSTPYYQNTAGTIAGGLLGAGSLGLGLAALMSSRDTKIPALESVPTEAIIEGMRILPVEIWRYIGLDPARHIGPYAEDFRAMFGFGDGRTIPIIDALGILFVVVKHILERLPRHV